jgi:hypothetical protein
VGAPHPNSGIDHGAVAEMHTIEIAHGNDHSLGDQVGRGIVAYHGKVGRHLLNSSICPVGAGP